MAADTLGLKHFYQRARRKYLPKLLERTLRAVRRDDLRRLGTEYGGWWAPADLLGPGAVVYCVGCGEDISFDLALVEQFGCDIWACDPTPRAVANIARVAPPTEKYHFRPCALWSEDGTTTFFMNDHESHVSGSLVGLNGTSNSIEVECRTLPTLMAENGHRHIDLIKMDIEGAEYAVLEQMLDQGVRPRCVMVEFDQPTPFARTHRMIRRLRAEGYDLVKVEVWNYVFVRDGGTAVAEGDR